jgi:hypothetical protein
MSADLTEAHLQVFWDLAVGRNPFDVLARSGYDVGYEPRAGGRVNEGLDTAGKPRLDFLLLSPGSGYRGPVGGLPKMPTDRPSS